MFLPVKLIRINYDSSSDFLLQQTCFWVNSFASFCGIKYPLVRRLLSNNFHSFWLNTWGRRYKWLPSYLIRQDASALSFNCEHLNPSTKFTFLFFRFLIVDNLWIIFPLYSSNLSPLLIHWALVIILGSVPLFFSGCYTISRRNKLHRIADVAINLSGKDVGRKCIFQCGERRATGKILFRQIFHRLPFQADAHGVEVCEWTVNPLAVSPSPRETGKW